MRAREMHNKLDKLSVTTEEDHTFADISLLSPEDQDFVHETLAKIEGTEDEDDYRAKVEAGIVTEAELGKLFGLWSQLPKISRDDKFGGPDLEIPDEIEMHFTLAKWHDEGRHHWPRFDFFRNLTATQKVRFVELSRKYGWEGEYPRDHSRRYFTSGRWGIPGLLPLGQWDSEDEAEVRSLLDAAEKQ